MKIKISCKTCGNELWRFPYQLRTGRAFCDSECYGKHVGQKNLLTEEELSRPTYFCPRCEKDVPRDGFRWIRKKSNGLLRRRGYCIECSSASRKSFYRENKRREAASHRALREFMGSATLDDQLHWWFTRHIHGWRLRTSRMKLEKCDLTAEFLVALYHKQNGLCHYSGQKMIVNTFGVKHAGFEPDSMSLDRKDPSCGYIMSNVVLCTYMMNTSKGRRTDREFVDLCRIVAARFA